MMRFSLVEFGEDNLRLQAANGTTAIKNADSWNINFDSAYFFPFHLLFSIRAMIVLHANSFYITSILFC